MGTVDLAAKEFLKVPEIFADACNYFLFAGEHVLDPTQLISSDPELILSQRDTYLTRYRDGLKQAVMMVDGNTSYVILGIEEQTTVQYGLCIKLMLYDAMQYAQQIDDWKRVHKQEGNYGQGGAFLEGLHKDDRLAPVITLVLYLGKEPYDGPRHLLDLLEIPDERLLPFIQDYQVFLLNPQTLTEEELRCFRSELGPVLRFIKYCNDRSKVDEILHESDTYHNISREASGLLKATAGISLADSKEDGSEVEFMTLWEQQFKYGEEKGYEKGIEQGIEQGIARGVKQGRDMGDEMRKTMNARTMLADGLLSLELIAKYSGLTLEQVKQLASGKSA